MLPRSSRMALDAVWLNLRRRAPSWIGTCRPAAIYSDRGLPVVAALDHREQPPRCLEYRVPHAPRREICSHLSSFLGSQPEERAWIIVIAEPSDGQRRGPPKRRSDNRRPQPSGPRSKKSGRPLRGGLHGCGQHDWRETRSKTAERGLGLTRRDILGAPRLPRRFSSSRMFDGCSRVPLALSSARGSP